MALQYAWRSAASTPTGTTVSPLSYKPATLLVLRVAARPDAPYDKRPTGGRDLADCLKCIRRKDDLRPFLEDQAVDAPVWVGQKAVDVCAVPCAPALAESRAVPTSAPLIASIALFTTVFSRTARPAGCQSRRCMRSRSDVHAQIAGDDNHDDYDVDDVKILMFSCHDQVQGTSGEQP
jgi:hypothetical protein